MSTFNPTPAELALTIQFLTLADPQKVGIVTGDTAVKLLSGANLSTVVLGEVWGIADKDNNGFLTRKGVAMALRLIGHAQKGEPVTEALLDKPGPLAYIDGVSQVATDSSTPSSPGPQSSPSSAPAFPPLTQQDKIKFLRLFIEYGPVNGLLSGEKSRDVFVKSRLPYEKLSHIWTLADTKTRGALDCTDFTIGMYFIQALMSFPSLPLPATLPARLYDQAAQSVDTNTTVVSNVTGGSASTLGSPLQSSFQVPRQYTGSGAAIMGPNIANPQLPGHQSLQTRHVATGASKPSLSSPAVAFSSSIPLGPAWSISAEAKASSDQFFDGLDSQRRGYIEGDVAVPFMLESKLPGNELAQIWDLADFRNDGRLTREGFAVAMHIIKSRLSGNEIPTTLPPSLLPPHLRPSTITAPSEPQLDLLLDDTPPGSAVQPQKTSGSRQSQPLMSASHDSGPDIFSPSEVIFSTPSQSRQPSTLRAATNMDLLSDDDDAAKGDPLHDNSAEIGNLRNQLSSTTRSFETTQAQRVTAEQLVAEQALQLSQLQTQLTSARVAFETESQLLATLRERLTAQRVDIQKTREELISAESELSAMKVEKAEVEGSVLRDKEEVRELQRKMKAVGVESEALRAGMERAKKDIRQQKGLLAIAKKQLATAEVEKLKIGRELEVVQQELGVAHAEKESIDARISELENVTQSSPLSDMMHSDRVVSPVPSAFAAGIPLPDTPQSTTPQPSVSRQSTNPFERLALVSMGPDLNSVSRTLPPANGDTPSAVAYAPFQFASLEGEAGVPQAQTSTAVVYAAETAGSSIGPVANLNSGFVSPISAVSTPETDGPFLTPPSTANVDHDGVKALSAKNTSLPGAYPSSVLDDGFLAPVREIGISETSDSDDEALGTKLSTAKMNGPVTPDGTSVAQTSHDYLSRPEPPTASKPTFDDTFCVTDHSVNSSLATEASPTIFGKSIPGYSRSSGHALSTRPLSSSSITGALDPFTPSTISQIPLEPPAGEGAPPPTIEMVLEPSTTSSINDFDEALGKLPNTTNVVPSAFKFDSVFDDNFDFSSAGNSSPSANILKENFIIDSNTEAAIGNFPPVPVPTVPLMSAEVISQAIRTPVVDMGTASIATHPGSPSLVNGNAATSFDDAFGLSSPGLSNSNREQVVSKGTEHSLDTQEISGVPSTGNSFSGASLRQPVSEEETRSPSPPARPASPPIRPASPRQPRVSVGATSPPPRASSPRMRASPASKASSSENKPEGQPRHKLSIRFPFGRKDKSKEKEEKRAHSQAHQQLPNPQQFLSPASEPPPPGAVTPAVEDDVEPVKQLAAMGFSRTQSVAALEAHGYDMQKALNSLLGAG